MYLSELCGDVEEKIKERHRRLQIVIMAGEGAFSFCPCIDLRRFRARKCGGGQADL